MKQIPSSEELYEIGRILLKGYGFKQSEIYLEYPAQALAKNIQLQRDYRLDMVGLRDDLKVGLEFGHCDMTKLMELRLLFNVVIWLPYWTLKMEDNEEMSLKQIQEDYGRQLKQVNEEAEKYRSAFYRAQSYLHHVSHLTKYYRGCRLCEKEQDGTLRI